MHRAIKAAAHRARRLALASAACTLMVAGAPAADAAPLTLFAAGSLTTALGTIASDFTAATGVAVTTNFQPSGTIRSEIEAGARPDLFASADTGNPLALQQEGLASPVVAFASNSVVAVVKSGAVAKSGAVVKSGLGITSSNLLSTILNPTIRVATSTPGSDPLGDYTEQVFSLADGLSPGAQATLDAKALRLVGGPNSPTVPAGQNSLVYFLDTTNQADVFLTYYTSAIAAEALAPDLQLVTLPSNLAVAALYGETVLNGADPGTAALENYILSPSGQAVLASNGFGPPAAVPEPSSAALLGFGFAGLMVAAGWRQRRQA